MERKQASDFPQELLDLFHEYQHGEINRRTFLDRAAKFAVGGMTVGALYETLKPNYAWAEQVPKDDKRIKAEYATVQSPQGNGSIKGYYAQPASGGKHPAVLVIHENRGLNPYIEDVARRFATNNFIAFAPDGLTSVGGYPGDDEQGAVKFRQVNGPKMFEDFVASAEWLKGRPESSGKLGAIGFCFGGGIVNQLAVRLGPGLSAGAPFYGAPPSDALLAAADNENVFYLDIGQKFLDEKGVFLPESFRPDNLHPLAKGYDIWGQAVSAKLAELMR